MRRLLYRQNIFDLFQKRTVVLNPQADYLATPSTNLTKPHRRIKLIFYTPLPSPILQLWSSCGPI